jgi:lauroyl/myristoyl acyltransferase
MRWIARRVGGLASVLAFRRRAIVMENLAWLAPALSNGERRRATRRTFANMLGAAIDLWRLPSLRAGELDALVGVEGREHLDAAVAMGRGVIVVTGHLGPYELGGAWLAQQGYPVHAVVEELDPETSAALALYREATGMKLVPRSAGIRALIRLLRDRQLVILVADRVVGKGTDAMAVPFGSGSRAIPTGPAALALATGAPIIVGVITTARRTPPQYLVHLKRAIVVTESGANRPDRDTITQKIGEELSAAVQAYPDQWFVFQPHWIRPIDASRSQGP